jgi:hypothetical protein
MIGAVTLNNDYADWEDGYFAVVADIVSHVSLLH